MTVHRVNFGASERKLARFVNLIDERDGDYIKDPKRFFKVASDQIMHLWSIIENAKIALHKDFFMFEESKPPACNHIRTINVGIEEYQRLKACERIIKEASMNREGD